MQFQPGPEPMLQMKIQILELWDEQDVETKRFAEILLIFAAFERIDFRQEENFRGILRSELQEISNRRFGTGLVEVSIDRFESGSISVYIILSTVAVSACKFFKDYPDMRKGVITFCEDIRQITKKLLTIVKKYSEKNGERS